MLLSLLSQYSQLVLNLNKKLNNFTRKGMRQENEVITSKQYNCIHRHQLFYQVILKLFLIVALLTINLDSLISRSRTTLQRFKSNLKMLSRTIIKVFHWTEEETMIQQLKASPKLLDLSQQKQTFSTIEGSRIESNGTLITR